MWAVTVTNPDGTTETMNFPFSVDDFCNMYADLCLADGSPDIVAICEDPYQLPPETFEGTNFLSLCEVDYDYACEVSPELCVDGGFSTDLCAAYPEMCDATGEDYNECAVDLYNCLMDPDFELCAEFPEVCGYLSDIEIPQFEASWDDYRRSEVLASGDVLYTCKAEITEMFGNIKSLINTANGVYGLGIYPGAQHDYVVAAGVRKWSYDSTTNTETMTGIIENAEVGITGTVPELPELENHDDFDMFDDIFDIPDVTYDILGGSGLSHSLYTTEETDDSGNVTEIWADVFTEVFFGYRVSANETEPTYLGIMFETTMPEDIIVGTSGKLVNWAKYEMYVNNTLVDSAAAVCIVNNDATTGNKTYEARTYEFGAEGLGDINNPDLESYRLTGSDELWTILEGEDDFEMNYGVEYTWEGALQRCLVAFEFDASNFSEEDYAVYQVESGIRLVDPEDDTQFFDFEPTFWST